MRDATLATALVGVLVLTSACGRQDGATEDPGAGEPEAAEPRSALTFDVRADAESEPRVLELTCGPDGGDHPQPVQACERLSAEAPDVFSPIPEDQPCTMIYGGPQVATVAGTWEGEPVDAVFSRENGCELERWERLGTAVFDLPLQ